VLVRRVERGVALAAAALIAAAAFVALQGSVDVQARAGRAAAWTRTCAAHPARGDRERLAHCARVQGRVLWVRKRVGEVHLALIARLHLFVVKLAPGAPPPGVGSTLTAIGPLVRASNGMREVQAFAASP
jgi:hypothetical protein